MLRDHANNGISATEPEVGVAVFDRAGKVVFADLDSVTSSPRLRRVVLAFLEREAGYLADATFVTAHRRSSAMRSAYGPVQAVARFTDVASLGSLVGGGLVAVVGLAMAGRAPLEQLKLTRRERQIADLLLEGLPYGEIAERLRLAEHTVKWHLSRVYRKAQVRSRGALVALLQSRPSPKAKTLEPRGPRA